MVTSTREKVLDYVSRRIAEGFPPTVREVQRHFAFKSSGTARQHLDRLVADGRLERRVGLSRGFSLPASSGAHMAQPVAQIPIVGRVQAGGLTPAFEDIEGYAPVSQGSKGELFALKVKGESMKGAGIFQGDLVIVRRQPAAETGEIVVAMVDGETTVKRLYVKGGEIELRPENPDFDKIVVQADRLEILGKVIEVRRYL